MKLAELQRALHGVLRREVPLESGAAELGVSPVRLAVYRDFVFGHVRNTLAANFPRVRSLLTAEAWDTRVAAYFHDHPPTSWEINEGTAAFPGWLAESAQGEPDDFLAALATFEWELLAAALSPEPLQPGPAPRLNPTLAILSQPYPVLEYVARWRADAVPPAPAPLDSPRLSLIFRHPATHRVQRLHATDELLFALKVIHEGLDPEAAAEALGAPPETGRRALAHAIELGLVL